MSWKLLVIAAALLATAAVHAADNCQLARYKNAIKDYSVVIKQQPENAWSLYGLGLSEARAGLTAQGEKHRQAAIALDPAVIQGYAAIGLAP